MSGVMRCVFAAFTFALIPVIATPQTPAGPRLSSTGAPSEREAVLAAVQTFLDTMAANDAAAARRVLVPEGRFFFMREEKGESVLRSVSNAEYLDRLATRKTRSRERIWDPDVRIHGSIAVVWTRYDFWIDGRFSHCGVDAFDLVKTAEGWKLAGGVYTVERSGCPPSPLGPLK